MVLARVLGPLRQYAPKVAAPKGKGSAKKLDLSAKPFSVFDEAGLPIKDFKTFEKMQGIFKRDATIGEPGLVTHLKNQVQLIQEKTLQHYFTSPERR